MCSESEEVEMFTSGNLQDLIEFKWETLGYKFHLFGVLIHQIYILVLWVFITYEYIFAEIPDEHHFNTTVTILSLVAYPFFYELT